MIDCPKCLDTGFNPDEFYARGLYGVELYCSCIHGVLRRERNEASVPVIEGLELAAWGGDE